MQVLKSSQFLEQVNISPQNLENGDFLGGPVAKNLPSNAGDMGSIPGQGTKIPHATGQLSPRPTTTESTHRSKRSHMLQQRPLMPQLRLDAIQQIN